MRFKKAKKSIVPLSGKELFKLWLDTGSTAKMAAVVAAMIDPETEKPYANPATGRSISGQNLRIRAVLWLVEHPDEARPIQEKYEKDPIPEDDWQLYLLRNALEQYKDHPTKLAFWIRKQPDQEWYRDHEYIWTKYIPNGKLEIW